MKHVIFTNLILLVIAVVFIASARTSSLNRFSQSHAAGAPNADETAREPKPVACTLSAASREGRQGVFGALAKGIIERKELDDGFAFGFPAQDEWLNAITEVVALERKCCAFFTFRIVVEPERPIWLELAGPEGTKDFLRTELGL